MKKHKLLVRVLCLATIVSSAITMADGSEVDGYLDGITTERIIYFVHGRENIAAGKPTEQSSTAFGGSSFRAVDGITNGNYFGTSLSVTHTDTETSPWWEVDLGTSSALYSVNLFNRTDCCTDRLSNFYVFISDKPFGSRSLDELINDRSVWKYHHSGSLDPEDKNRLEIEAKTQGRYVRVQNDSTHLSALNKMLSLAEVEVLSATTGSKNVTFDLTSPSSNLTPENLDLQLVLDVFKRKVYDHNGKINIDLRDGVYRLRVEPHHESQLGFGEFKLASTAGILFYAPDVEIKSIDADELLLVYADHDTGADSDISIWRPKEHYGYYSLGDIARGGYGAPSQAFLVKDTVGVLAKPVGYTLVWADHGSGGSQDVSLWRPIAPSGYTCIGHVISSSIIGDGYVKPSTDVMRCINTNFVLPGKPTWVWNDRGSGADSDAGVWRADAADERGLGMSTFISQNSHNLGGDYWSLNRSALNVMPNETLCVDFYADTNFRGPSGRSCEPQMSTMGWLNYATMA